MAFSASTIPDLPRATIETLQDVVSSLQAYGDAEVNG